MAQEMSQPSEKNNKFIRILVILAFILPMVGAYFIFKTGIGMPSSTINKGDLLTPATQIKNINVLNLDGQRTNIIEDKLWRIIMVGNNQCDSQCMELLYLSRQVHTRLNEKSVRVERVYLNTEAHYSEEFRALLAADYPRLKTYHVAAPQWQNLFRDTSVNGGNLNGHQLYYVDQEGFAMMTYDWRHDGADLLSDIKRLLKYSYDERG